MKVKSESEVTQLCLTLSDQARVLEWGAIVFSGEGRLPGVKRHRNSPYLQSIQSNDNIGTRCYGIYPAFITPVFFLLEPPCSTSSRLQTHEPDWPNGPLPLTVVGMDL